MWQPYSNKPRPDVSVLERAVEYIQRDIKKMNFDGNMV